MRNEYIHWLQNEIEVQTVYHNHKETMAWVATALYIPSIIVAGNFGGNSSHDFWHLPIVYPAAGALVFCFVWMQFRWRNTSAETVAALMAIINEMINGDFNVETHQLSLRPQTNQRFRPQWPQFIQDRIHEWRGEARTLIDTLLTDGVCYVGIAFATLASVLLAWRSA